MSENNVDIINDSNEVMYQNEKNKKANLNVFKLKIIQNTLVAGNHGSLDRLASRKHLLGLCYFCNHSNCIHRFHSARDIHPNLECDAQKSNLQHCAKL